MAGDIGSGATAGAATSLMRSRVGSAGRTILGITISHFAAGLGLICGAAASGWVDSGAAVGAGTATNDSAATGAAAATGGEMLTARGAGRGKPGPAADTGPGSVAARFR